MIEAQIDDAILAFLATTHGHWRKVAMVIAITSKPLGIDGSDGYGLIARRVETMVDDGRLEVKGDVKNWRFSEVRLP